MRKTILAALVWLPGCVLGAEVTPLFSTADPMKAVLTAPILQAYKDKGKEDRFYLEGQWSSTHGDTIERLSVKIRARGNYRRKVCDYPPLLLNFKKKEVEGTLLTGQDKLKMVSPCERGDKYQQLIYLEYLVYQLFALYSDYHFRTRLVEIAYVDSQDKDRRWQSTNFLIEDVDHMAARYDLKEKEITATMRTQMDLEQTALVEIFQYMIGNVDYSTLKSPPGEDCCHNIKLIAGEGAEEGLLPVAYDFDSTGLINAPYATVPESVPIKRITTRYFNGWCKERARYEEALARVNERKAEAMALFEEFPLLSKVYRSRAIKYLEKSYDRVNDQGKFERDILDNCRGDVIKG
jgi:hypothetical protein